IHELRAEISGRHTSRSAYIETQHGEPLRRIHLYGTLVSRSPSEKIVSTPVRCDDQRIVLAGRVTKGLNEVSEPRFSEGVDSFHSIGRTECEPAKFGIQIDQHTNVPAGPID